METEETTEETTAVECVDCQNDDVVEGVVVDEENEHALGYLLGSVIGTSILAAVAYATARYIRRRNLTTKVVDPEENAKKAED